MVDKKQVLEWLRQCREDLNLHHVAERVNVSYVQLQEIIDGKVPFPKDIAPPLNNVMNEYFNILNDDLSPYPPN